MNYILHDSTKLSKIIIGFDFESAKIYCCLVHIK